MAKTRRERLDEEHIPLIADDDGQELAKYGPSLITVIFNVSTLIDATLFFITGSYLSYKENTKFMFPRIPSMFMDLLPSNSEPPKKKKATGKSSKKCAFFTITHNNLVADVKLFQSTAHVCGLRSINDAREIMEVIRSAFTACQEALDDGEDEDLSEEAKAHLEHNRICCSLPLVISEGDVVMTNLCGKFPKNLNLRTTYELLREEYPGVLAYLTTMSKSNYLVITLFEKSPFEPVTRIGDMDPERLARLMKERKSYLLATKRSRSKHGKHTFFIYASGRFIQSSRNNSTALSFTKKCMRILTDNS